MWKRITVYQHERDGRQVEWNEQIFHLYTGSQKELLKLVFII